MTAEIVVMNKNAIALAADSAVTVQVPTDDLGFTQKIYKTTNKLFMLSKYHPVGAMVFGNSEILGTPWEVIIKIYRKGLGTNESSTIENYASGFINYIDNFFSEKEQEDYFFNSLVGFYSGLILEEINNGVKQITEKEETITEDQIRSIVDININQCYEELSAYQTLSTIPEDFGQQLISKYHEQIEKAIKVVFEELPISEDSLNRLRELAVITRIRDIFPNDTTGLVIAGFGNDEIFPAVYAILIHGVVNGKLKYKVLYNQKIDNKQSTASIIPFAQHEMVAIFMEGVDPDYNNVINGYIDEIFDKYPKALIESLINLTEEEKSDLLAVLSQQSKNILDKFSKDMLEYRRKNYIDPILSAVSVLPKDELAEMAESLVNLTSFKRRVSMQEETVGGPIDVAVISKGDGFVWIKRKHYFDADLNHQYFANYFREG